MHFGIILRSRSHSVSILLLSLANIVYHIDFIKDIIDKCPGPIFNNPNPPR